MAAPPHEAPPAAEPPPAAAPSPAVERAAAGPWALLPLPAPKNSSASPLTARYKQRFRLRYYISSTIHGIEGIARPSRDIFRTGNFLLVLRRTCQGLMCPLVVPSAGPDGDVSFLPQRLDFSESPLEIGQYGFVQ